MVNARRGTLSFSGGKGFGRPYVPDKNLSSLAQPLSARSRWAGPDKQLLFMVAGLIVLPKEVLTEVTVEVAPDGVDVVSVVLRVV